MANKDAALKALIEPVVTAMGFELWGVDYLSQGKHSRPVSYTHLTLPTICSV